MSSTSYSKIPLKTDWVKFGQSLEYASRSDTWEDRAKAVCRSLYVLCPPGAIACALLDQNSGTVHVSIPNQEFYQHFESEVLGVLNQRALPTPITISREVAKIVNEGPTTPRFIHRETSDTSGLVAVELFWQGDSMYHDSIQDTLHLVLALFKPLLVAWRRIQHESMVDPLTGAENRRALYSFLQSQLMLFHRYDIEVSILMLDANGFKQINDTAGHEAGDQVLCELVTWIRKTIRSSDRVFRYGGDEFILILPSTNAEAAAQLAARISSAEACSEHTPISITFSIGAASARKTDSIQDLLKRADKNLYTAKHAAPRGKS